MFIKLLIILLVNKYEGRGGEGWGWKSRCRTIVDASGLMGKGCREEGGGSNILKSDHVHLAPAKIAITYVCITEPISMFLGPERSL